MKDWVKGNIGLIILVLASIILTTVVTKSCEKETPIPTEWIRTQKDIQESIKSLDDKFQKEMEHKRQFEDTILAYERDVIKREELDKYFRSLKASLNSDLDTVDVLTNCKTVVEIQDSVINTQEHQIENLYAIITDKDIIISNKDSIIEGQEEMIEIQLAINASKDTLLLVQQVESKNKIKNLKRQRNGLGLLALLEAVGLYLK